MTIINRNFKKFFDITKLQELYPYKSTQELELIKNYCCKRTIHYIHILQGKLKIYDEDDTRNINFPFRRTIQAIETEKEEKNHYSYNDSYEDFYNSFIHQLKFYKQLHDSNDYNFISVYENISIFSTLIYVMFFYMSQ